MSKLYLMIDRRVYQVNLKSGLVCRYVLDGDIEGWETAGEIILQNL